MLIVKNGIIYTGEYKGTLYSKDNPLWAKNIFEGNPPKEFESWSEWVEYSTEKGLFKGVKIKAIVND